MLRLVRIRVLPRSSRNEVVGEMDNGVLKVKLNSAPVDGEANVELVKLLSKYFGVGKSDVKIVKGKRSKDKVVEVEV